MPQPTLYPGCGSSDFDPAVRSRTHIVGAIGGLQLSSLSPTVASNCAIWVSESFSRDSSRWQTYARVKRHAIVSHQINPFHNVDFPIVRPVWAQRPNCGLSALF